MARWLVKSDPDDYAFADLARDGKTLWDGITNAAALGHLRRMKPGDDCLVYETGGVKAIVGRARVAAAPRADRRDPKLVAVELAAGEPVKRPLTLAQVKADPAFATWELVRNSRLSVMPVPEPLWERIGRLTDARAEE
ncbi:MAG: EVE domain-containing protein [Myxococcota bacterium]